MGLALGVLYLQINFIFVAILSGLIEISVYSCGELRKASSERKINMKKLAIILTITIMLLITQKQRAEHLAMLDISQNAASAQTEKVLESNTEQAEETKEVACASVPTEATKEETVVQETPMKECAEKRGNCKSFFQCNASKLRYQIVMLRCA